MRQVQSRSGSRSIVLATINQFDKYNNIHSPYDLRGHMVTSLRICSRGERLLTLYPIIPKLIATPLAVFGREVGGTVGVWVPELLIRLFSV
jgi:hypothetical protein